MCHCTKRFSPEFHSNRCIFRIDLLANTANEPDPLANGSERNEWPIFVSPDAPLTSLATRPEKNNFRIRLSKLTRCPRLGNIM